MADLTIYGGSSGTPSAPVFANCAVGGDKYVNSGREYVIVRSTNAGAATITVAAPNACPWGVTNAAHDLTFTVAAGNVTPQQRIIGPFDRGRFADPSDSFKTKVTSSITDGSVTISIVSMG